MLFRQVSILFEEASGGWTLPMMFSELLPLFATTAATALAAVLLLWLISIAIRDVSIIDMAFSSLMAAVIYVAWYLAQASGVIATVILVLVTIWALRMTLYLVWRNWGHGEDVRYTKLRSWVGEGWPFYWLSLRQVFLLQGVVVWLATLPQQIAMANGAPDSSLGVWAVLGIVLWCTGFFFETVGDIQLSHFKAKPENKGKIMNLGLWRYTRHPNYFGELAQWWGLFLISLQVPWAWLGVVGPLVYSWLIVNVTGQATLDKKLAREKPGYAEYMQQTSGLIPMPPRR